MFGFFGKPVAATLLCLALIGTAPVVRAGGASKDKPSATKKISPADVFKHTTAMDGLLPVHVDAQSGKILITLPPAGIDGVSVRFLYATALRTGLGSAPTFLDRGRVGNTQVLAFRRYGNKVAAVFENPRFRAAGAGDTASPDFATSIAWMGDIASTQPDGRMVVDLSGFLASDTLGIAQSLDQSGDTFGVGGSQGAGKGFALDDKRSAADAASASGL